MALTTDVLARLVVSNPATGHPVAGFFVNDDLGPAAGVAPFLKSRSVPIPDGVG
jgi:hypothetical protein